MPSYISSYSYLAALGRFGFYENIFGILIFQKNIFGKKYFDKTQKYVRQEIKREVKSAM